MPKRRPGAGEGGYLRADAQRARRYEAERRRARVQRSPRRGLRPAPRVSTVLKDDLQDHVDRQLVGYATGLSRADSIRHELQSFARSLTG
jgi:hypothetical protein